MASSAEMSVYNQANMVRQPKKDDDKLVLPGFGTIPASVLTRFEKMSLGYILLATFIIFFGASAVWSANRIAEPLVLSQIEKDHALVSAINLSSTNAQTNQQQTRDTIQLLISFMQQKHEDDIKMHSLMLELRDEIRAYRREKS